MGVYHLLVVEKHLKYLQEKETMRNFKFFHGIVNSHLTAHWNPELVDDLNMVHAIDAEEELTRMLSEEIAREVDNNVVRELTRRINGGGSDISYLSYWMGIGGNRA